MDLKMQILLDNYQRVECYVSTMKAYCIKCYDGVQDEAVITETGNVFSEALEKAFKRENGILKSKSTKLEVEILKDQERNKKAKHQIEILSRDMEEK